MDLPKFEALLKAKSDVKVDVVKKSENSVTAENKNIGNVTKNEETSNQGNENRNNCNNATTRDSHSVSIQNLIVNIGREPEKAGDIIQQIAALSGPSRPKPLLEVQAESSRSTPHQSNSSGANGQQASNEQTVQCGEQKNVNETILDLKKVLKYRDAREPDAKEDADEESTTSRSVTRFKKSHSVRDPCRSFLLRSEHVEKDSLHAKKKKKKRITKKSARRTNPASDEIYACLLKDGLAKCGSPSPNGICHGQLGYQILFNNYERDGSPVAIETPCTKCTATNRIEFSALRNEKERKKKEDKKKEEDQKKNRKKL